MRQTEKTWKKIVSVVLALAVVVTMVPASVFASYEKSAVHLDATSITLEKNVIVSKAVAVKYVTNDADSATKVDEADIKNIEWATESSAVKVTPTEDGMSAEISAERAGKAEVTVTATYDEGEGEKKSTGTVVVEVYETPAVTITAEPSGSETDYPTPVIFNATSSSGVTPELTIKKDGIPVDYTMGTSITLNAGTYEVNASAKADGYYKEAKAETLTYIVKKGQTSKEVSVKSNVYWNEQFSFMLPSQNVDGTYKVEANNLTIIKNATKANETVEIQADKNVGQASVTVEFIPNDENNYDGFKKTADITVKKVPVKATWDKQEKVYDGTTVLTITTAPDYKFDGESEYIGFKTPIYTNSENYTFTLDSAEVGGRKAVLNNALVLDNAEYYELSVTTPQIDVEVSPVVLDETYVNSFVGMGKEYDGTSTAEFHTAPSLNNNNGAILDVYADWTLTYTAKYYDKKNKEVYGNPDENVTAEKVIISDLGLEGTKSANYKFPATLTIETEEGYNITANANFEAFTGLELGETVDGVFWLNPTFWSAENDKGTIRVEGFQFAVNPGDGEVPNWVWSDSYEVTSTPSTIYAKNTTTGLISQVAKVAYDKIAPTGQFFVKIGEEQISITEFIRTYKKITKEDKVSIKFEGSDADSKIKTVEWCASSKAWDTDELSQAAWDENAQDVKTLFFAEDGKTNIEKKIEKNLVTDAKEMKKFYYAKVTDYAGNVSYISSSGVLQDVKVPVAEILLKDEDATYNDRAVYNEDIKFDIKLSDEDISSGISKVKVTLSGNGAEKQEWTTNDLDNGVLTWSASNKLTAISVLNNAKNPTNEQIESANSGDIISATITSNIPDCNYYTLTVVAYDKAGNVSLEDSVEFIKDSTAPDVKIDITGLENENEDAEEGIYQKGYVIVTVKDMTLITKDKDLFGAGISLDEVIKSESKDSTTGLITKTYKFVFGLQGPYLENAYTIDVKAEDSVGKTGVNEKSFTIDYTEPVYVVNFSNADKDAYSGDANTVYYNKDIIAEFTIAETKSFEEKNVRIKVYKEGQLLDKEKDYESAFDGNTNTYTITIKADKEKGSTDGVYTFAISGKDKAGHKLKPETTKEQAKVDVIRVMDATNPVLESVKYDTINDFNTVKGKDYVNAETKMTFEITERNPTTNKVSITSIGEKDLEWALVQGDRYQHSETVPMNGEKGDEQEIALNIIDKAGNKAVLGTSLENKLRSKENTRFIDGKFVDKFTVDTVAPKITYEYVDVLPTNKDVDGIDYFGGDATVKVTVDEHNFNAGLFEKSVGLVDNKVEYEDTGWNSNRDIHTNIYTFDKDNQYDISVVGTDNAKNIIVLQTGETSAIDQMDGTTKLSVALDKTLPSVGDATKPIVVIAPETAPSSTIEAEEGKEQPLYNTDVTYEVVVYDPLTNKYASGIDGIEITATGEDGTTVTRRIDKKGDVEKVENKDGLTVAKVDVDEEGLAKGKDNQYVYNVVVSKDVFNTNGIVLSAKAVDVSGNSGSGEAEPIAIDITAPEVTVSYDNNDVSNGKYFHARRTATISVKERNFSDDCMTFVVNGKEKSLNFKLVEQGEGNRDNAIWEATYPFTAEDDYIVKGNCVDRATNQGTVTFTGEAPEDFTLDYTKPIIGIEFDNNKVFNMNYYDAHRVATITITEHNFRASDVQIIGTASDAGTPVAYPQISAWTSNGDVHKATLNYNIDARYTLDVTYSDLATNAADDVAEHTFTVDTVDPQINIRDVVNEEAYPGVISPSMYFSDNNYDRYEISFTHTNKDETIDVKDKLIGQVGVSIDTTGKGVGSKIIENLEYAQENDGIYKLTIRVSDKAGRSTQEEITYSVNRFGTVYVYSPDLADLLDGYHQEIGKDLDLSITAYNPDQLLADSTKLEITWDGAVLAQQKSKADTSNGSNDDGWYKYVFALSHEDFVKEGRYEITISDKDEAGNTRTNSDAPISFYVDKEAPQLELVTGLEKKQVYGTEQKVKYTVTDTIGLGSIEIWVDGKLLETITEFDNANTYEGSFMLGVGKRQEVKFVIKDKSGRELNTLTEEFSPEYDFNSTITVSDNVFVLWYDNTILFWGTMALLLLAVGGFIFLIVKKRNKEDEEEL